MNTVISGSHGYIGSHLRTIIDANCIDLKLGSNILDKNIRINGETLIHLAALVQVGESVKKPFSYYDTNINGTINLLNNFGGNNFIFASTGAVEQMNSPYAISKRVCEDIIIEHCLKKNINFTIFRFYNVIGSINNIKPTNPDGLFYALSKAPENGYINVYGNDYETIDGTCIRDYVHVMEICDALKMAISTPSNKIESLGHGKGHSVLELINTFKQVNNIDFDIVFMNRRPGDSVISVLNNVSSYMKELYSIEEMVKL